MGLIGATASVFDFLRDFWYFMPVAIRLLVVSAFGGVCFIALLRMFHS